jgi:hypothetical protein
VIHADARHAIPELQTRSEKHWDGIVVS